METSRNSNAFQRVSGRCEDIRSCFEYLPELLFRNDGRSVPFMSFGQVQDVTGAVSVMNGQRGK